MKNINWLLFVATILPALTFGLWQHSLYAGLTLFFTLNFVMFFTNHWKYFR